MPHRPAGLFAFIALHIIDENVGCIVDLKRRELLIGSLKLAAIAVLTAPVGYAPAYADDDGESDNDDSGNENHDDDSGGEVSGSSGSNSGNGNSGSGSSSHSNSNKVLDQNEIRSAINNGRAVPLGEAIRFFQQKYDGRIINVDLRNNNNRLTYQFKFREAGGRVRNVSMDARSGRFLNFFGF